MSGFTPIEWLTDRVRLLDQTRLPQEEVYLELATPEGVALAIMELKIRGAPAIGVAAAYGMALGARKIRAATPEEFREKLQKVKQTLAATRPTARNLFWALERMEKVAQAGTTVTQLQASLVKEALQIHQEAREADDKLAELGAGLIPEGAAVLTHCNTGVLATAGYGTALGVIKRAHEQGQKITVYATETRPLLQGSRLTCWELQKAGIPATLITDSMAGYFLSQGKIQAAIVGADRIAANGDTANKIGTYTLAVLARENNVPFYVAAPTTTIDPEVPSGAQIPIEERSAREVTHFQGACCAPEGMPVANPAFDVTPHRYITAIVTEKGIIKKPFGEGIRRVLSGEAPAGDGNVLRLF